MARSALTFEQNYDLPPEIVWDALVDSDLVSGWLAEAQVDPRVGGRYDLEWVMPIATGRTIGEICELAPHELLVVELERIGTVTFRLTDIVGGTRGSSSLLTVAVEGDVERKLADGFAAAWITGLEQLEELLRGHPVDWSTWMADHGDQWSAHLDRLRSA